MKIRKKLKIWQLLALACFLYSPILYAGDIHSNVIKSNIEIIVAKKIGEESKYVFLVRNNSEKDIYIYPFFVGGNKLLAKWKGLDKFKPLMWIYKKFPPNYKGIKISSGQEMKKLVDLSEYIGKNAHSEDLRDPPDGLISIKWQISIMYDDATKRNELTHLFYLYKE